MWALTPHAVFQIFYARLLKHGQVDLAVNQARQSLLASAQQSHQTQIAIPSHDEKMGGVGPTGITAGQQPDKFWPFLLRNIEMNRCTVFLGHVFMGAFSLTRPRLPVSLQNNTAIPCAMQIWPMLLNICDPDAEQLRDFYLQLMVMEDPTAPWSRAHRLFQSPYWKSSGLLARRSQLQWTEHIQQVQEEEPHRQPICRSAFMQPLTWTA